MAPSFFSKLVKSTPPVRDRSESMAEPPRTSTGSLISRNRAASAVASSTSNVSSKPPLPPTVSVSSSPEMPNATSSLTINTLDSDTPNVTVVPPTPLMHNRDFSPSSSDQNLARHDQRIDGLPDTGSSGLISAPRSRTTSTSRAAPKHAVQNQDDDATPTATRHPSSSKQPGSSGSRSLPPSRPVTPSSSTSNLRDAVNKATGFMIGNNLELPSQARKQPSNKSPKQAPPPLPISAPVPTQASASTIVIPRQGSLDSQEGQDVNILSSTTPIIESPTNVRTPEPIPLESAPVIGNGHLTARRDSDATSIKSNNPNGQPKEKKRPWRRTTAARKPTGLASAIAASGLAMANHSMSAAHQAQLPPTGPIQPTISTSTRSAGSRKGSIPGSPPYIRSPAGSAGHIRRPSEDMSPKSKRSNTRSTKRALSVNSDNNSEYYGDERPDYYSGLEEGSSGDDDGSESEDDLMDLDLGEDDIPVTGFAVASNRRNADFHDLFPNIPEGDYLIEDYGCALQREILIQGRIYISENHICFHANIFGWITDLSIPIYDITHLEKKMTAFVIPNAIQITTRRAKYTFASFLSRDTTFDVIYNIWRLARPEDAGSIGSSGRGSLDGPTVDQLVAAGAGAGAAPGAAMAGQLVRKATQCACGVDGLHYSEVALETVLPGTPEKIHYLIFASGFIKDFMAVDEKLLDIQMADWSPTAPGSKLLARNMSYIKPLNGSLGPKQTKCEIRDENVFVDFDEYVSTVTTTRTPDVPSGGVFSVKTRTCIMWASAVSSKIIVTTNVEWTGRSFIKGIIERSAIDGQKVYHADLERAMRAYIQEHQTEFVPEGIDPAAIALSGPEEPPASLDGQVTSKGMEPVLEDERKKREREQNQRGLQWAWETFDGASQVARQSTKGALELIRDGWEQSSSTTILYFVIVGLVLSNLWTLTRMGSKEEAGRRKELKKLEEREKWVQGIVTALWDELAAGKNGVVVPTASGSAIVDVPAQVPASGSVPPGPGAWQKEVSVLRKTLDEVEDRVRIIRDSLTAVEQLDRLD